MTVMTKPAIHPQSRTIDGVSIRFAESELRNDHVAGRRDLVLPLVNAEFLHERLPLSKLAIIERGHFLWEDAADKYAALVSAWWDGGYAAVERRPSLSASTAAMTSSTSAYTTPAFWERLWRTSGIQFVGLFIIASVIYGYSAAGRRVGRRTRRVLQWRSHADPDRCVLLRPQPPQPPVVRGGGQDHPGGCGARRLGRGGDRRQRSVRSAVPPADHGGRCPRVLDRRLRQSPCSHPD